MIDAFDVAIFEDRNANGTFDDTVDNLLGTVSHTGGLLSGATVSLTAEVAGVLQFFGNPIHVFVDSANAVLESREDNNVGNTEPACSFLPPMPAPLTPVENWSWNSSPVQPTKVNVISTPIVVDLDVDGFPEVAFTSRSNSALGAIRIVSGLDGSELFTVEGRDLSANDTSCRDAMGVGAV